MSWMQAAHSELDMRCQATPALRSTTSVYLPVPKMRRNRLLVPLFCGQNTCCFLPEQVLSGKKRKAGFGRQQFREGGTCTAFSREKGALLSRTEKEERNID